jgi:SAM-dependent methyltransferase
LSEVENATWADYYTVDLPVDEHLGNLCQHSALFKAVLTPAPERVLEVGVGSGAMSLFLGSLGIDVVGVDNDLDIVAKTAQKARAVTTVSYQVADAFTLRDSFGPASFDVAFSQGFFEHFDDDQIRELVAQQLAVAKRVVFSVPSNAYPTRDVGNERLMTPGQWASILQTSGTVRATGYQVVHRGWFGRLKGLFAPQTIHVLVEVEPLREA